MRDAAEPAVIGIDVGGTKVAAGRVVGARALEIAERPTDLRSADALLDELEAAAREIIERSGPVDAVGLGVPSQIEFARGMVVKGVEAYARGRGLTVLASCQSRTSTWSAASTTRGAWRSPRAISSRRMSNT